jgi:hypothetical protein
VGGGRGRLVLTPRRVDPTRLRLEPRRVRAASLWLVAVSQLTPVGAVVVDLALLVECSLDEEWTHRIVFIPF